MKIRVYYEDTDAGGVVYHSHYLNFCERARSEAFFGAADIFDATRGHFLVSKANCAFLKSAHLGDILDVRSAILQIKNASVIIRQDIFRLFDNTTQSANLQGFERLQNQKFSENSNFEISKFNKKSSLENHTFNKNLSSKKSTLDKNSHKIQGENLGENLGEKVFSAEFTLVFVKNSKPSPMSADLKVKFKDIFRE